MNDLDLWVACAVAVAGGSGRGQWKGAVGGWVVECGTGLEIGVVV